MGHIAPAKCLDCGEAFRVRQGGSFTSHLLRCDACGKTRLVHLKESHQLRSRHGQGCLDEEISRESGRHSEESDSAGIEPVTEADYRQELESLVGTCECGGRHTFDAPARCPSCRSVCVELGRPTILYD